MKKLLKFLGTLAGAAIGSAILWLTLPLLIILLSAAGAFFEIWLAVVIYGFPIFIVASIAGAIWQEYKKRKAKAGS
ncbi:hypothetical protein [Thermosinus carboxydivorans]|uniref:hypothetical protein n=1 Tax=Thermosinus carboxydivorans TaxID=261685 RepID=UPI0002D6A470|nr:hypothetical protein [Thermosinus carboxydivorans]